MGALEDPLQSLNKTNSRKADQVCSGPALKLISGMLLDKLCNFLGCHFACTLLET